MRHLEVELGWMPGQLLHLLNCQHLRVCIVVHVYASLFMVQDSYVATALV